MSEHGHGPGITRRPGRHPARTRTNPGESPMANQAQLRQSITDQFVEVIQARHRLPWRESWPGGLPTNVDSGRLYRGINLILMQLWAFRLGLSSPYWGTQRQWERRGGRIRPRPAGTSPARWGCPVIYFQ